MKITILYFASIASAEQAVLSKAEEDAMWDQAINNQTWGNPEIGEYLRTAAGVSSDADETLGNLRRLKQLKVLILHLQPEHRFARYCYYGCWCLPDATHDLHATGMGQPVDEIDMACKRQYQCYECAEMDHPGRNCQEHTVNYNYQLTYDNADPNNHMKKGIECLDDPTSEKLSCRRSVCECDKKLSEDLREYFSVWFVDHHMEQGTFDRSVCIDSRGSGGAGGSVERECCGEYPNRFPYSAGAGRSCCGQNTYNPNFHCCDSNNQIKSIGNC